MDVEYLKSFLFIYIGTVFYSIAAFYHLSFEHWTLNKALLVAIPLVILEYIFSLTGNKQLNHLYNINPLSILLITMCFYFINLWLLNFFVLKNDIDIVKEFVAFIFIIFAFLISANIFIIK
jgi:hypothetical protein